jgi:hypothetical protein
MTPSTIVVGIDVSKDRLDLAWRPTGERWAVPNTERGIRAISRRLRTPAPTLIVLEATGGLELPLTGALAAAGLPVVVITPRQVRDFAKATGRLAKTDAIDAAVLAQFAEAVRPEPRPLPDAATQARSALLTRRRQLIAMRTAEQHRLETAPAPVRTGIRAHLTWLEGRLAELDEALPTTIRESPLWRETDDLLQSTPGVGGPGPDAPGEPAGVGDAHPATARGLGGGCAPEPGQWPLPGQPSRVGRAGPRPSRVVHGDLGRHPLPPTDPRVLSAALRGRESQEGGRDRLYAEAAHDPECDAQTSDPVDHKRCINLTATP